MKRNIPLISASLLSLMMPLASQAEDLNVDFTATVLSTTCVITLESLDGSSVATTGADDYSLTIPDVGLDKIVNAAEEANANFALKATGCAANETIKTKISGTATSGKLIKNDLSDGTAAANIGVGFKLKNDADTAFITPDGSTTVAWTSDQITNGMEMTASLRETASGTGTLGVFQSKATFSFTYQ